MTNSKGHRQNGQTERQRNLGKADPQFRARRRQYGRAAPAKHQPECAEQFAKIFINFLSPYFYIYHQVIGDRD